MAFDFPASPAINDKYTDAVSGTEYVWNGVAWDLSSGGELQDYVAKAGDVMTGQLQLTAGANLKFQSAAYPSVGEWVLQFTNAGYNDVKGGIKYRSDGSWGALELWGGQTGGALCLTAQGGNINVPGYLDSIGGLYATGGNVNARSGGKFQFNNTDNNAWQTALAMNSGIQLQYHQGGNNDGRLRIWTQNGGYTDAYVLETTIVSGAPGIIVNGNASAGSLTSRGGITSAGLITSSVAQGANAIQLNDGARINLSNGCLLYKNYGSNDFMFHTNASQVFTFHISGTGDVYVIDTVGSTGNSVNVTAPESLAIGAELGVACERYDKGDRIDVMKVVAAMLVKIKALETELATLRK